MDNNATNKEIAKTSPDSVGRPTAHQSVFDMEKFPAHTRPWAIKPKQAYEAFTKYGNDRDDLETICKKMGMTYSALMDLKDEFPELKELYLKMRKRRVEYMLDKAEKVLDDAKDTILTERGTIINAAAVRKAEAIAKLRMWHAERILPEYASKQQIDTTNRTMAINLNVSPSDAGSIPADEILGWFSSNRR